MRARRPIHTDAALRDLTSEDETSRQFAAGQLAHAILQDLRETGPLWNAASKHPRGFEATDALLRALEDPHAVVRALAATGLGLLGDARVVPRVRSWLEHPGDPGDPRTSNHGEVLLRECAVIALTYVATVAPSNGEQDQPTQLKHEIITQLSRLLWSQHSEVRFQASLGLVEVTGASAESELLGALDEEQHPDVRFQIVYALAHVDPPSERLVARMCELLRGPERQDPIGFEAAMIVASARHHDAGTRLLDALANTHERDRALEGLAALGPMAPEHAHTKLRKLAKNWWVPGVTRVRAAYALARIRPDEGRQALDRMAQSLRPAIREAARDARRGLVTLAKDGHA